MVSSAGSRREAIRHRADGTAACPRECRDARERQRVSGEADQLARLGLPPLLRSPTHTATRLVSIASDCGRRDVGARMAGPGRPPPDEAGLTPCISWSRPCLLSYPCSPSLSSPEVSGFAVRSFRALLARSPLSLACLPASACLTSLLVQYAPIVCSAARARDARRGSGRRGHFGLRRPARRARRQSHRQRLGRPRHAHDDRAARNGHARPVGQSQLPRAHRRTRSSAVRSVILLSTSSTETRQRHRKRRRMSRSAHSSTTWPRCTVRSSGAPPTASPGGATRTTSSSRSRSMPTSRSSSARRATSSPPSPAPTRPSSTRSSASRRTTPRPSRR